MIRYGLLGPVATWRDGHQVDLGSPQQRTLVALLLLHRNETVSIDRMADVLWPKRLPANAVPVLRTYVARLRTNRLDPHVLLTRPGGYELRVSDGEVDADRLDALVTSARVALRRGNPAAAAVSLTEALALMRGPILTELSDDDRAVAERVRLEELCATVGEELTEARLAQGDHRELVPTLRAAVATHPVRERIWGQLMVALYRSGRQAEALEAYRAAHGTLAELGLQPGAELRDLERRILLHDPALGAPADRVHRVPRYHTSLVGRDDELDAVQNELLAGGLVSIVGPAGAGKTRVAAEAAGRAESWLGPLVWWVDLAAVGPGRVAAATARTLAAPQLPGLTTVDAISARLSDGPGLLVLDNCEHVIEEAAVLTARLLEVESSVHILTTSREALRVADERVVRLAGLPARYAARLLCERAEAPPGDVGSVAEVVARLDGLPLAIELAASKLRSLSVADLAREVRERLSVLGDGPRDAPERQRSLEAAIAWSYDLRSPAEQHVLRQLAVFPGSFDAAAAESVAGTEAVPTLTRLVDASLVAADPPRFHLLMTVRTYAQERLREAGEEETARRRHRDTYLALAETVGANMVDAGLGPWLARGRLEHENFQAALRWSRDRGDTANTLELTSWLSMFWFRSGFVRDGRALLERAMAAAGPGGPHWPRAMYGRAMLEGAMGSADALPAAGAAVSAAEEAGDQFLLALALCWQGHGLLLARRRSEARTALRRARSIAASVPSDEGIAFADQMLGDLAMSEGDLDQAAALLVRARDRYRRSRGTVDAGYTLIDLTRVRLAQHDFNEALTVAGEAIADFRSREDPRGTAHALWCLGQAYAGLGQPERARHALDEARALTRRWGFALWPLGQSDEPGQEPAFGAGVQALADERSRAVGARVGEEGDRDISLAEELR
ncbi:MAG TPA: BTAD domain-containing putative transcriptional regulator [Microlunatus sp.]